MNYPEKKMQESDVLAAWSLAQSHLLKKNILLPSGFQSVAIKLERGAFPTPMASGPAREKPIWVIGYDLGNLTTDVLEKGIPEIEVNDWLVYLFVHEFVHSLYPGASRDVDEAVDGMVIANFPEFKKYARCYYTDSRRCQWD
ncbi:MAG: hypothetical protein V1787_01170 [Candidatus Micrarchaeota archaeon]